MTEQFESALTSITQRAFSISPNVPSTSLAIAYSGGLDSSVLLHLVAQYATAHKLTLYAFHVHHGLSPNADKWSTHCAQECAERNIRFDERRVNIGNTGKTGVEEAARHSRYAALGDMCRQHQVPLILTAHHQDDQAETVLLQLLRGSGVAGLSGMDNLNTAPTLLNDASLQMARPLLAFSRAELEKYAVSHNISYVEDESNDDPRYARNALRSQVMPVLSRYFGGFQERLARTAGHMQSSQRLLIELAAQDLSATISDNHLNLPPFRQLSADRQDNLLRYWFGLHDLRMPSSAWLSEARAQLLSAKDDAQICVTHPECHIRRHRDRVFLTARDDLDREDIAPIAFRWNGESEIAFPIYGGTLHFDVVGVAEQGVDPAWLRLQSLQLKYRSGGERLKLAANRPTKPLKNLYQAMDIPAWERETLPLVHNGAKLLFAAGLGMDSHQLTTEGEANIRLRWQADNLSLRKQLHNLLI
ncbi:tRNA lysidine(34) synthetase TilS [Glaciimonas soli]|uniref:tRNA(Ile)-lysidine synthase n=1 Tax=Glaciimonas soli TaxID=2590999 RepID=A0A843YRR6_9BURK|nr:tRNA lysidine(34) synthetase TilS [Glaciimonas soli]MQQ99405.1 tRNA lysidine(34) synthetase TilS [Glaciimonas soli]